MKFLTVRDLRSKSAQIWKELPKEKDMIVTNNGKPVAILTSINSTDFEESLNSIRKARAIESVASLQKESVNKSTDKIPLTEINQEIKAVRKKLRKWKLY